MYRDYKVRLKMSMFRPIKQEDYIDVYENPYAMITYVALRIMGKDDMYINENNNTNISKRKDIVFR